MKNDGLKDFTTEELVEELGRRKKSLKEIELDAWASKTVSEGGIRPKDLLVILYNNFGDDTTYFGLALKKKWKRNKYLSDDWNEYSDWHSILPGDFGEASENSYEYNDGSLEEAISLLKRCGFSLIRYDWETGIEKSL